jgi:hypothetical protein
MRAPLASHRGQVLNIRALFLMALCAFLVSWGWAASADDSYFEIFKIKNEDRSAAADLADFNGDGRVDVLVVALRGLPPIEERVARVYLQNEDGTFGPKPSYVRAIPKWSSVYDLADIRTDSPGTELILLRPGGLTILSLAAEIAPRWDLDVSGPTTAGVGADERGFEYFKLVHEGFGPEPVLFVQQIGQLTLLEPSGQVRARMKIPRRANYLIFPTGGLISVESNFQIFLDVPKLLLGDINGDDRTDITVATRHELHSYLQQEDGGFPYEANRKQALNLITKDDHVRGSGGVTADVGDVDGDGLVDLLLSYAKGGFSNAETITYYYRNRDGRWNIGSPDQMLKSEASLASNALVDLDMNGRMELVRLELDFSLWELIEILLSREFDVELSVHSPESDSGFQKKPSEREKLELPFSTTTFRLKGFFPTVKADLNGDGYPDFLTSGGGEEFVFKPGGPKGPIGARDVTQDMFTDGMIRFGDWTGDGLLDFLIFDPQRYGADVHLAKNRGRLPGTPESLRPATPSR